MQKSQGFLNEVLERMKSQKISFYAFGNSFLLTEADLRLDMM